MGLLFSGNGLAPAERRWRRRWDVGGREGRLNGVTSYLRPPVSTTRDAGRQLLRRLAYPGLVTPWPVTITPRCIPPAPITRPTLDMDVTSMFCILLSAAGMMSGKTTFSPNTPVAGLGDGHSACTTPHPASHGRLPCLPPPAHTCVVGGPPHRSVPRPAHGGLEDSSLVPQHTFLGPPDFWAQYHLCHSAGTSRDLLVVTRNTGAGVRQGL